MWSEMSKGVLKGSRKRVKLSLVWGKNIHLSLKNTHG